MRYDSCRQCIKRRIVCDKGTPRCRKCIKKNIECSGVGKKYQFVVAATSRKTRKPSSVGTGSSMAAITHSNGDQKQGDTECQSLQSRMVELDIEGYSISNLASTDPVRADLYPSSHESRLSISPSLQSLGPSQRMLFDHFSAVIAPYMVAFDAGFNGYRDLILPFACHDPLVQRAVSVVSALHLSHHRPEMRRPAELGRAAILAKLREDSMSGHAENVFTLSTWTTLVILLVGETVTGSSDFVHLFTMLRSLIESHSGASLGSRPLATFLSHQSDMFQLFTPPLLGASRPLEPWSVTSDHFDFLITSPLIESLYSDTIRTLTKAFQLTYTLSVMRNGGEISDEAVFGVLEQLRHLVTPIEKSVQGAHSLAWVYFMAAAESTTPEHRIFFSHRLCEIYNIGNFGNIPVALQTLESIWSMMSNGRWTSKNSLIAPVLII